MGSKEASITEPDALVNAKIHFRPSGTDTLSQRIAAAGRNLSPAARTVARYIENNGVRVLGSSAAELGSYTGTSDATVVRAVQALGFSGLEELRQTLMLSLAGGASLTNHSTPAHHLRETLADAGDSIGAAIETAVLAQEQAIQVLRSPAWREEITAGVVALHKVDRIAVFGIGPSSAIVRYAAILLRRTGRSAFVLDATGSSLADQLLDIKPGDAILALAYTRPYAEIAAVSRTARRQGACVVMITDNRLSKLADLADILVEVPRGQAERVALHGATVVTLEALVLGLAASDRTRAMTTLERLNELRDAVGGHRTATR